MAETTKRLYKRHGKLTKELNRPKMDLNDEGNKDIDLNKRQLRSRMIVVPTHRVFNVVK